MASPDPTRDSGPTSLYRYYDEHGVLLYAGITSRGVTRNREHNSTKEWWQYVARQEVEHFRSRPAALARETEVIRQHTPPFNKQHNPWHDELREGYLHARADLWLADPPLERIRVSTCLHLTPQRVDGKSAILRTDLVDAGVLRYIELPVEPLKVPIGSGRARDFAQVGPFLTVRITGTDAIHATSGELRVRYLSQKPVRLGVRSINVRLDPHRPSKTGRTT